ncbi:hypothetical protein [Siphonobacter curvatus]|uniref:Uncharacterized protein n=1 Tax=Siphonobacter curvatus TaxID=2094562 RepID=A0A2S7II89_9BACT|nr:hypothetical protein [Siphonobacter curvatus]PQA55704.1 hypothetical protein C5O19_20060 [Siphonobacter curvatus]
MKRFLLLLLLLSFTTLGWATTPVKSALPLGLNFGITQQTMETALAQPGQSLHKSVSEDCITYQLRLKGRDAVVKGYFKNNELYLVSIEYKIQDKSEFDTLKEQLIKQQGACSKESSYNADLQAATCQWNSKNGFVSLVLLDHSLETVYAQTARPSCSKVNL